MLGTAVEVPGCGLSHAEECSSIVAPLALILEVLPDRLNHVAGAQHHHVVLAIKRPFRKVAVFDQLAKVAESSDYSARSLYVVIGHRGEGRCLFWREDRLPTLRISEVWRSPVCGRFGEHS